MHQSIPSDLRHVAYLSDSLDEQPVQSEWGGMSGWLDKRQEAFPHSWLRRWVVVRENTMMWSDRMIHVGRHGVERERHRWNKTFDIKYITEVQPKMASDRQQRKFKIVVKRGRDTRHYTFRAMAKDERDGWTEMIQKHVEHYKQQLHVAKATDSLYLN